MSVEEKEKKIAELRNLLSLAKNKIEELKAIIIQRDKELAEQKVAYDKKIKDLEVESAQIMKQYEERLLRYQKSLEESDNLVSKYQAQAITNSKSNEETSQALTLIGNLTMRIFTLTKVKDSSEAVEELCNIEKCKEFAEEIERIGKNEDLTPIIKSTLKLTELLSQYLVKKREARISFGKKEANLKKALQDEQMRVQELQKKCHEFNGIMKKAEQEWQTKIDEIAKSKLKMSEEKANLQFIKQLMLKTFIGPKDAASMALEVLSRVLKMSPDEVQICQKKLK